MRSVPRIWERNERVGLIDPEFVLYAKWARCRKSRTERSAGPSGELEGKVKTR